MSKALIAMSGGVDSSVAALLTIQEGFDCVGATMKLYESAQITTEKSCCAADDAEDARAVAARLGIPFYVFNFKDEFEKRVILPFIASYEAGSTPNPCIECNKHLKFEKLFEKMRALDAQCVVTGHYARIEYDSVRGRYLLKKALDSTKDQSYVLYSLTQEQLAHIRFPLGEYTKEQTRAIAELNGFANAKKHESQDICFVPDGNYVSFIKRFTGKEYQVGNFVDRSGNVLGQHKGIISYTVGQRKGLGLALPRPMYVCRKDLENNEVVLCYKEELGSTEVIAENVNWISVENPEGEMRLKARVRYNQPEQPALVYPLEGNRVKVVFESAQKLPAAKGQALVLYDGDIVVGGGTITDSE